MHRSHQALDQDHQHGQVVRRQERGAETSMSLIVNSIPKSGTHLVMRALELAGMERDYSVAINSQGAKQYTRNVSFLPSGELKMSAIATLMYVPLADVTVGCVTRKAFIQRFSPLAALTNNRFVGGHMLWFRFGAVYLAKLGVKMIVVLRDPRAVALSHIHWALNTKHKHILFERYRNQSLARSFSDEILRIADTGLAECPSLLPLLSRYRNMALWQQHPQVHFTTFEALVGPRGNGDEAKQFQAISRLLAFAEIDRHPSKIIEGLWGASETFRSGMVDGWKANASDIPPSATDAIEEMIDIIKRLVRD
jgi:hypothetical protein